MQKHIFKGTEKIKKNYKVVFKIWAKKKKWTDHPIHPSILPSIKIGGGAWYPVARILGESTERLLKSPLAHTNTGPTVQIRVISYLEGLVVR